MWRNYRLSLSFANLIYLRAWADLIPLGSSDLYHRKILPGFNLYFALVGDVLALSLLVFLVICLAPSLTLLFLIAAVLAFRFSSVAIRLMKGAALAATPCLAVTFVVPLFYLSRPSPLPPDPPLAHRLAGSPPVRVLWIVFDDWDYRLTFPDRAPGAVFPTLDDLAGRSFAASQALAAEAGIPVYDMATDNAIPSLLYGKHLIASGVEGPAIRRLLFARSQPEVLGLGDSVFARMASEGWNSAVAGWYLPYCRVFASQLTDCYWEERYDQASSARSALFDAAVDETRMLFETDMYSPFGWALVDVRHFGEYEALLAAGRRYAADPSIGLAFIHFNVPHAPFFYNPAIGRFGRPGHPDDLYAHALRWVDSSVRDILASVKSAGLDSRTAIILSSDHPARLIAQLDPHVPFIVHLPGEQAEAFSTQEFSALRTADLVLAIARGEVQSPADIQKVLIRGR
jgi:hypothetical protein